jgi:hypothetical protein
LGKGGDGKGVEWGGVGGYTAGEGRKKAGDGRCGGFMAELGFYGGRAQDTRSTFLFAKKNDFSFMKTK